MATVVSSSELVAFVDLQKALLAALGEKLGSRPVRLLRAVHEAGSSGALRLAGEIWVWWRRGAGVRFESERGEVVDVPDRLHDATEVDAERLQVRTGRPLLDLAVLLGELCDDGLLGEASLPGLPDVQRRYRLVSDHFFPDPPWVRTGAIDLHYDLVELRASTVERPSDVVGIRVDVIPVLEGPLSVALEQAYDPTARYDELPSWRLSLLVGALRRLGMAALDTPDREWWVKAGISPSGREPRPRLVRGVYDLAWSLADWIDDVRRRGLTLSIVGV